MYRTYVQYISAYSARLNVAPRRGSGSSTGSPVAGRHHSTDSDTSQLMPCCGTFVACLAVKRRCLCCGTCQLQDHQWMTTNAPAGTCSFLSMLATLHTCLMYASVSSCTSINVIRLLRVSGGRGCMAFGAQFDT